MPTTTILKEKYSKEIIPALMKKFDIKNAMRVPKMEKVVLNV
ncbi:MAG TPA: 50S ribosomal protein L5, partial [bacterium]|nr:50S ribosomal protein L5 [bacterium]